MNKAKKSALHQTYNQFMETGFKSGGLSSLQKIVVKEVAGFGSAKDEKIKGLAGLKALLHNQKKQMKGMTLTWKTKPFSRYITDDENTAVFAEDVYLTIKAGKDLIKMYLRFSVVLNYINDQWKVIHWHGSKPEQVLSDEDTYGIDSLKQKNAELKKLVEEKTADLTQKNRELEIEAALERVRSRAMAMHTSNELKEVAKEMRNQLHLLGQKELETCAIHLWDESSEQFEAWAALRSPDNTGKIIESESKFKIKGIKVLEENFQHYRDGKKDYVLINDVAKARQFFEALKPVDPKAYAFLSPTIKNKRPRDISAYWAVADFDGGSLVMVTMNPPEENSRALLRRFADVFGLAYRRFSDLQKAEAQAREAQIEAALEKVRSRTMGMQKSEELKDVINLVYEQLTHLNIHVEHCGFLIDYKTRDDLHIWLADEHLAPSEVIFPWFNCPPNNAIREAKDKGEDFFFYHLNFKEKNKFYRDLFKLIPGIPEETIDYYLHCPGLAGSGVLLESIGLYIENFSGTDYTEEENAVLMRFGKVFQQTYTRFLDLQKAEAQAREAQIEAALERVRSRSMAMHKSEELLEVINVVSIQMQQLDIRFGFVCFGVIHPQGNLDFWMAAPGFGQPEKIHMPFVDNPITNSLIEAHKKGTRVLKDIFLKEVMLDWSKTLFENNPDSQIMAQSKEYIQESPGLVRTTVILKEIDVFAGKFSDKPFTDEQNEIIVRFANVFEQSYIRFLDLQKAEMQAREAKIEVSLEKVRTVALILKKSDEMLDVVQALYEALYDLGFTNIRNSIIDVHNPQKETFLDYDYSPQLGRSITEMSYYDSPFIENQVRKTEADNDAFFELVLEGKELQELIDMRLKNGEAEDPRLRQTKQLTYNLYSFGNGAIGISNFGLLSDEQKEILKRFRNVFAFAYKRYSDMVQAEAQAREAQIEAALEKVRSRTLAMQKSDELAETAAVLFQQLSLLGIEPNRLYINIMKDNKGNAEFWITDEDGRKISMAYADNLNNNPSFKMMLDGWKQQKKSLIIDMHDEELQEYFRYLNSIHVPFKGGLAQKRRLQYIAYFSRGFIGMASPDEQNAETLPLLERFAYVFNLTYTRFNDLKMAEAHAIQAEQDLIEIKAARKKAEDTLIELQATQKQLIQSEKMASLGELTAGIAHEIQNPLNFVNNFSEVSNELMEELRMRNDELKVEDPAIKDLLNDIGQNLQKINHHGQRAADIVKGMLQHSRSNTGQKELTDINALCDEYLRLAYHGLRAKDKSFNAKFETDFDESIGKVNIVPQEIGRVILNLINNAFYASTERSRSAVSDKKKSANENYEPTVIVATKKDGDKILISVKDNGNGIPEKIKDKIFQPFFTTKPTGSGTGLGLSLSYDIVKAHGGELKVESKEGDGSEFCVLLPG